MAWPCHARTACSQASWAAPCSGVPHGSVGRGSGTSQGLGNPPGWAPTPTARLGGSSCALAMLRSGAWHEQCVGPCWGSSEHRPEVEQLHVSGRGKPENCPLLLKPPEAPGKPRVGGCSWPQSVAVTPDFGADHSSFMLQRQAVENTKQLSP